ncbi:hypothetical protein MKX01_006892 [Papaver californicum]|nr:hypothetical protein MKX01_006892 [Papaver californicum]
MSEKRNEVMLVLDHKPLIMNEIIQARELVKELQTTLEPTSSTFCKVLITRILSSFETSLSMLDQVKLENESAMESSVHVSGSPISDCESDLSGDGSRKRCRKKLVRRTEKVRVCEQTGLEGPLDDGYSWRKYGQKDILGTKYPRGYYNCTFQKSQGCSAMKQVQRSELDSSVFNVTYIGQHSCVEGSDLVSPGQHSPIKQEPNLHISNQEPREKKSAQETYISFQTSSYHQVVKEEIKDFDNRKELNSFPSFTFPSMKVENCSFETTNINSSPTYTSTPTTSESNYNFEGSSGEQNIFQNSVDSHDSEIDEMVISSPLVHASSAVDDYPTALEYSCVDWDFLVDYSPPHLL